METRNLLKIPTLLMISLLALCGAAMAGPLDLSGSAAGNAGVSTDAIHADGAAAGDLAGHVTGAAHGSLDAQLPDVQSKVDDAKATATADAQTSTSMGHELVAGVQGNLAAFGGWIHGLFGGVKGDASANAGAALSGHGVSGTVDGAGHLGADVQQPPQPDLGFMGKLKAGITSMLPF